MKLSLLIPTIATRKHFLDRLLAVLMPQVDESLVEVVIYEDGGEISIGAKRNACVAAARGEYIAFIDDDDLVPDYYVAELLKAIETKPDCVGWRSKKFVDGAFVGNGIYSIQFDRYENRPVKAGDTRFIRTPTHISTIRADLVRSVTFANIDFGEDNDFAKRIRPALKREVFIDKVMYEYHYRSKKNRRGEIVHTSHHR